MTRAIFAFIYLIGIIVVASTMDFEYQQDAEIHYCDMIEDGSWPEFKDDVDCESK